MDEQNLVFGVLDDAGEFGAAADEVGRGELAFEDGVLEMVAETAHESEDFAEAAVVGDVVTDEIGLAHVGYLRRVGLPASRCRKTMRARLSSASVAASSMPMRAPSLTRGTAAILSAMSQQGISGRSRRLGKPGCVPVELECHRR